MTLKELFSVQAGMNELKSLSIELENLEDFNPYKSNKITDMPRGGDGKDINQWYSEEKERIENKIELCKQKLQNDRKMVDEYIKEAPYPERDIIRFRVVNNMSWEEIGSNVGYSRRNASKRFYRYIRMTEMTVVAHAIV